MRVQAQQQHSPHLGVQRPARGAMALRAVQQARRLPAVLQQLTPVRLLRTAAPERDWEEARSEHAVVREVRRAAAEHALLRPGDAVVACVSGGVDSVALLLALSHLAPELSLKLHVLHFNHGLRVRATRKGAPKQPQTLCTHALRSLPLCRRLSSAGGVYARGGAGARARRAAGC